MPWTTHVVGEVAQVRTTALMDLESFHCTSPEHSVKAAVAQVITAALSGCPEEALIEVQASGTQDALGDQSHVICTVALIIRPFTEIEQPLPEIADDDPKLADQPHRSRKAAPPKHVNRGHK